MNFNPSDRLLGALLLEQGIIGDDDLQVALQTHSNVGGSLRHILIDGGFTSEQRLVKAIEESLGIPLVNLYNAEISEQALQMLKGTQASELSAFPFAIDPETNTLRVAVLNPLDNILIAKIETITGQHIERYQAYQDQYQWALASYYPELGLPVPAKKMSNTQTSRIGQIMLRKDFISEQQLQEALSLQQQSGEPLGRTLIGLRYITEDELFEALSEHTGLPFIRNPRDYEPGSEVLSLMSQSDVIRLQAVPLDDLGEYVWVASPEFKQQPELENLLKKPVKLSLITTKALEDLIDRFYSDNKQNQQFIVEMHSFYDTSPSAPQNSGYPPSPFNGNTASAGQQPSARSGTLETSSPSRKQGKTKPLSEILIEMNYVTPDDVEKALALQRSGGGKLEDTLIRSEKISEEMLAKSLAVQLGYEFLNLQDTPPQPEAALLISETTSRRFTVVGVRVQGNALVVAMKDPRHVFAIDDLRLMTNKDIIPAVAQEKDITKAIERMFGNTDINDLRMKFKEDSKTREEPILLENLDDNKIVRLVDDIIREASLMDASDIHIEPTAIGAKVRFRVDGDLREAPKYEGLPKGSIPSIVARIKIMSNLDIAEKRIPQDGRVRFKKGSIDLDLRLSTLPTVYGEKIVMRLLQKASNIPEVEKLGFSKHNFQRFLDLIELPYGIFLITGPTGSGKSFTTFSVLKRISTPDKNTTTIEDPVEYEIPGINQTQVNNVAGLTFAKALKSFLRQDPDIIMVGEIRDKETAQIATEAALTGHFVIATLHTNDSPGAVTRLAEMGIEAFNITASLVGVLAQRLVRKICGNCKVEIRPDPEVLRRLGIEEHELEGAKLFKGTGCEKCNYSGYKGRMAVHELMVVDEHVRRAIISNKTASEIKDIAIANSGLRTLRMDGISKVLEGQTTLEEILGNTNE